MATTVQPTEFARAKGLNQADFSEACRNGETEYANYPIGEWTVRDAQGGVYLRVPDSVMESAQSPSSSSRSNPTDQLANLGAAKTETNWPEAAKEAGPPVAANLGASHAVASMSDAVKENPEIAETIADVVALLGSGGLGLAATEDGEDYRAAKVGGIAVAGFGIYKFLRHKAEQADRRTDMAERKQRHQMQKENQTRRVPAARGDGAPTKSESLTVTGSR